MVFCFTLWIKKSLAWGNAQRVYSCILDTLLNNLSALQLNVCMTKIFPNILLKLKNNNSSSSFLFLYPFSAFPSEPLIENQGPFLEGEEAMLRCTVPDVYPASHLRIQWLAGDRELQSEAGQYSSRLENATSILSYQLGPEDMGKLLTCRATLEMDEDEWRREARTTLQLHCEFVWRYNNHCTLACWLRERPLWDPGQTLLLWGWFNITSSKFGMKKHSIFALPSIG